MTDLGTLDGDYYSWAYGINNAGWVVGQSAGHACLWTPAKPVVVLVRGLQHFGTDSPYDYWAEAKKALDPDFDV